MLKSMTGYGRGSAGEYVVEVRSVNHRFLEVRLKSPGVVPEIAELVKKRVKETFSRGFHEVSISLENPGGSSCELSLDRAVVEKIMASSKELKESFGARGSVTVNTLLGFHGVIAAKESVKDPEKEREQIDAALMEALLAMNNMKEAEGRNLSEDFNTRLNRVSGLVKDIEDEMPRLFAAFRERYSERIKELAGGIGIDENRLAGEVAILADKSDISEELTRLKSHIGQFRSAFEHKPPIGKRLDFILQEMGREINTVGSKSIDSFLTERVVEIKTELERIREQVQNVE